MNNRLKKIIQLSRWQEFVPFTTILTWLAGLTAHQVYDAQLDWRLWLALVANLGAMAYAFMINEIEDAPDDARDPNRGLKNPIAAGELDTTTAWIAALGAFGVAFVGYAMLGTVPFVIGLMTLILAHLYSWRRVRLKARPLIDIISHALFLSALLYLGPFYIYADNLGKLWVLALGTFLISANGQLYNQERDFEADRAAGLHNTASVLGKQLTGYLATGTVVGFALCLLVSALMNVFPLWLAVVPLASAPVVFFLFRNQSTDMRGNITDDPLAQAQWQMLIIGNATLLVWLIVVLV